MYLDSHVMILFCYIYGWIVGSISLFRRERITITGGGKSDDFGAELASGNSSD